MNIVLPGHNYGWPTISYGEEYGGGPVGDGIVRHPGMTQPIWVYRPSIAPSDLTFLTGDAVEAWRGSALIGALGLEHLNRLTLDGDRVIHEERVFEGLGWRVRLVEEGPDGIYIGTDSGFLIRISGL